jgi:UDP-glucose 4-epimerase
VSRCLIVGANGFIGSLLLDELVSRGHEVTAFDRFTSGTNTFRAKPESRVVGDFMNRADVASALRGQEIVFHLVSTTTPASAENDPTMDLRTNVASSVDLLELCVEAGVKKVYFASTGGAIYGDQAAAKLTERSIPKPISPYAIGKLAIEGYLAYFQRKYGLEYLAFRISNPYGPGQRPDKQQGVIPIFLRQVHRERPLTVFGDGSMVRDYVFVNDVVGMIADTVGSPTKHMLYNIGSGNGTSISELLDVIRDVTGASPIITSAPLPSTFVSKAILDVGRFNEEFGPRELVPLHEGIERTWRAIREDGQ